MGVVCRDKRDFDVVILLLLLEVCRKGFLWYKNYLSRDYYLGFVGVFLIECVN